MTTLLIIILISLALVQFYFAFFMPWKKLADTYEASGATIKNKSNFIKSQKILHFLVGVSVFIITFIGYKNNFQLDTKLTIALMVMMVLCILPSLNKKLHIKF